MIHKKGHASEPHLSPFWTTKTSCHTRNLAKRDKRGRSLGLKIISAKNGAVLFCPIFFSTLTHVISFNVKMCEINSDFPLRWR